MYGNANWNKGRKNNVICIIDGDGQNPPYEVKKMIDYWHQVPKNFKNFCFDMW